MNIVVCVKQVLDPEMPTDKFTVKDNQVVPPEGIPPVINPYDEHAVELAIRLKEQHEGKITVLSLGSEAVSSIVKHALAMGADEGFVLSDKAFDGSDSFATAYILTRAIQKVGDYDLILCGRQAADWDEGVLGSIMADSLDLPLVTLAAGIDVADGGLKVKRATLDGYQVFAVPMPALVTVSSEVGQPRLPSGWGIISAARKQIPVWGAGDIDADLSQVGANAARRKLTKLFIPARKRECEIIQEEDTAEASARLAIRLREAKVI